MAKWFKRFLGLAALGGTIAGLIYYFKKSGADTEDDFSEDFEDEDFDLDSDLKPASDREYVSLTPKTEENEAQKETEELSKDDTEDTPETDKEDKTEASKEDGE